MIRAQQQKKLKKRLTISLAKKQRMNLEKIADAEERSVAFVVRSAVDHYLQKRTGSAP
jgi:hypothetical protein